MKHEMQRYSVIREKNPREIVLLRGLGCQWRRCAFCDYHLDFSPCGEENFALNREVLSRVSGIYRHLEVINSGSFCELDGQTMKEIETVCLQKKIVTLHFECHFMYQQQIPALRERFAALGTEVKIKTGVETFNSEFRERVLRKGIGISDPQEIARNFDEVCLLFGLNGQTAESMKTDVELGLRYFERVCINIMTENSTPIHPDHTVIQAFTTEVYPLYRDNPRVDVLFCNTDFGVGGDNDAE